MDSLLPTLIYPHLKYSYYMIYQSISIHDRCFYNRDAHCFEAKKKEQVQKVKVSKKNEIWKI